MNAVAIIVIIIICVQVFFFVKNLKRMNEFKNIFSEFKPWQLSRNQESGFVDGIRGDGNEIFEAIRDSINKYLKNNTGSVIDFGLLKDAVDRHCDSVENDIATQTPLPLYCGLAGTMAGVIIGLWDLLSQNTISTLMGSTASEIELATSGAADGINSLLNGVAWAMLASICGILLTTINSLLFKKNKLEEESGKNSFLAWMQSCLLPELPSDTSDALNRLVKNLNRFNASFAQNTTNLGTALKNVNESYAIQADIIQAVHDMDVMKMAKANVKVLNELKECTDKLEKFNIYLDSINGYTDAIHRFEEQFQQEANRIHVLEDIKSFFERHKESMTVITADVDDSLRTAITTLKENSEEGTEELKARLVEQSDAFKGMMAQERDAFEEFAKQLSTNFSAQLSQMPQLVKHLENIADIPARIDKLIEKVNQSNERLSTNISYSLNDMARRIDHLSANGQGENGVDDSTPLMPQWMQWVILACVVIVTAMFGYNFVNDNILNNNNKVVIEETETQPVPSDNINEKKQKTDSSQKEQGSPQNTENAKQPTQPQKPVDKQVPQSTQQQNQPLVPQDLH